MRIEDWLTTWRRRLWRFAGALVIQNRHKWSFKAFSWSPGQGITGFRKQSRPQKKWDEDIA
eukprot:2829987-Karenia_brevis.AAC.1